MRGLVSREWAQRKLRELSQRIEAEVMQIPRRMAATVAKERDALRVRALLDAEIRLVLTRLADALEGARL